MSHANVSRRRLLATLGLTGPSSLMSLRPRAAQAARSRFSRPTPSRPTTSRRGAASSSGGRTWVRLRTMSPRQSASAARRASGLATSCGP